MSRNDEKLAFHYAVYDEVQQIPNGKVTTYGHIAKLIYRPQNSRQVGQSLKLLPRIEIDAGSSKPHKFHVGNVPWWRVVNARGEISPRGGEGPLVQRELLRSEGIDLSEGKVIDLVKYGYFPQTDLEEP